MSSPGIYIISLWPAAGRQRACKRCRRGRKERLWRLLLDQSSTTTTPVLDKKAQPGSPTANLNRLHEEWSKCFIGGHPLRVLHMAVYVFFREKERGLSSLCQWGEKKRAGLPGNACQPSLSVVPFWLKATVKKRSGLSLGAVKLLHHTLCFVFFKCSLHRELLRKTLPWDKEMSSSQGR